MNCPCKSFRSSAGSVVDVLWTWDSLFALVSVGLWHWLGQLHLKLVAAQRHLLVMCDECEQRVEHQVIRQVELGAAGLLPRVNPAVLNPTGPPEQKQPKTLLFHSRFTLSSKQAVSHCSVRSWGEAELWLPEGESVVSHEGLALPHQERAVRRAGLQTVLRQQTLCNLTPVTPRSQLPVKPLLRHMLVHAVTGLEKRSSYSLNAQWHECVQRANTAGQVGFFMFFKEVSRLYLFDQTYWKKKKNSNIVIYYCNLK